MWTNESSPGGVEEAGGGHPGAETLLHHLLNTGLIIELQTKVHTKVLNHGEGPYLGLVSGAQGCVTLERYVSCDCKRFV